MKKYYLITLTVLLCQAATAQYNLKEVTSLDKFSIRDIKYYNDTKEWVLSDGYLVFKLWNNFNEAKLLFNTFPKYQFDIDKLPNKNFYCRHFDKKSAPFGYEYRTRKLDSSAFYIMGDSLKQINPINPSTYVKIRKLNDGNQLMVWGSNNCFIWGKDSVALCNNGTIGVVKKINGKDSLYLIETNNSITSLEISKEGSYTAVGTKDSGWYFISTLNPDNYIKVKASDNANEISGFYFDEKKKHVWIEEGEKWVKEFKGLRQYDYNNGFPKLVKGYLEDDFGIKSNEAVFAFDFEKNIVFIKSIINRLIVFDLKTSKVKYDFFWDLQKLSLSVINGIYFNESDDCLYLSAGKYDSTGINLTNFLMRAEKDTQVINVIIPKNNLSRDSLYQAGMQTAVNKMPASTYSTDSKITLANNDLALIPFDNTEFMLYNIRSGNLIKSFPSKNIDLNIESSFREKNTAHISPNGKTIVEWMIKAGVSNGIADTLTIAIINVETGLISRNKLILSAKKDEKIGTFFWDEMARPSFTLLSTGEYPIKKVKAFYLDNLAQPQIKAEYSFTDDVVFSMAWYISKTNKFILETFNTYGKTIYKYLLVNASNGESNVLLSSAESIQILQNDSGFLFRSTHENKEILNWYNLNGVPEHQTELSNLNYRIQDLVYYTPHLYLTELKSYKVCRLNLKTGEITVLKSISNPGYNFRISADGKLLISVSDEIQTWQIENESLHKLYSLKTEKDFITYTQITNKHLISDGRVWNMDNGLLVQTGAKSLTELDDSLYLQTVYNSELLEGLGWDDNYKKIYGIKPHQRLFCKSLQNSKNLDDWEGKFKGTLIASRQFLGNSLHTIYEVPLVMDGLDNLEIYPINSQNSALIIKNTYKLFDNDIRKSPPDELLLLNLETGECINKLRGKIVSLKQLPGDGAYLFYLLDQKTGNVQLYRTENSEFRKVSTIEKFTIDSINYLHLANENSIVYRIRNGVEFRDLQTGKREQINFIYLSGSSNFGGAMYYDIIDKALYVAYDDGGILKIVDKKVVECVRSMPTVERLIGIQGKYLLTMDKLGNYYFINKNTLEADLTLLTWKGNSYSDRKYMWLTKENYYMATPGVESNIHFVINSKVIPLKQGDLMFNRPDKVLHYLDAPKSEIDFYNELYQIRLNKYKGTIKDAINQITCQLKVESILRDKNVILEVDAGSKYKITKLNIVVNGCPINVDFKNEPASMHLNKTIEIPINAGNNSIYTWVEDEKGNRSMFDERKIVGEFNDSGKWYFIGIGVSAYKDTSMNLKYADKDIRDIAKFLSRTYPGIIIDTLLNEQVNSVNIQKIAAKLRSTKADDKVLISLSGHGLLDSNKRFWYATHDLDFDKPNKNGFSMTSISAMVENIPARYRLITIDACHSGDVITGISPSKPVVLNEPIEEKKDVNTIKGAKLVVLKRGNHSAILLKSMQRVFTDQLSNTGINVIAASSGTEYALEGKEWNNGVFTYALINGWAFGARENPSYGKVHYRNLKQYLQNIVSTITHGSQTPNTVMENGEIDWWLIPGK